MNSAERLSGTGDKRAQADILSHMYSNQVGVNLGKGLADPYIPVLALSLGADAPQLGWLQAFINLFPAVMQVPWGKLSDLFRRRIPFLIVGGVMSFALYFFMIGAINSWHLIIIVAIQLCIGSMMIPTWSALVGDVTTLSNRGSIMSGLFAVASLASVVGMLIGGLLVKNDPSLSTVERFGLPFFMAGFMGMIGSLILYQIMEKKRRMYASPKTLFAFSLKSFVFTSDLKENLHFRNLVVLNTFFNFIMSIIWPVLYLTYIDVLHASALEIGIISITSTGATLFFQTKVGRLLDVIGPMPQILISRFAFISVPIVYALATEVWHIYAVNIALGFASAMANVAFFAYIMDVAPDEKKGEYFAVYNTLIGIATFFGSIIGGYLAFYFQQYYAGELVVAFGAVYAISAIGRTVGAFAFMKLKDPVKYPQTLTGVIRGTLRRWRMIRQ